ncbi:MAG: transposase [Arsenophonus sp.]
MLRVISELGIEFFNGLQARGLTVSLRPATVNSELGFWNAIVKIFQDTKHQRCYVHKTA